MLFSKDKIENNSFTLIELMVVIGIIGILITMVVNNVSDAMSGASKLDARTELKAVGDAHKAYEMMYGVPPSGSNTNALVKTLKAVVVGTSDDANPKRRKFLDTKILLADDADMSNLGSESHNIDMWGETVVLSGSSTAGYTLTSPGEDGNPSTTGDNVTYTWE